LRKWSGDQNKSVFLSIRFSCCGINLWLTVAGSLKTQVGTRRFSKIIHTSLLYSRDIKKSKT